METQLLQTATNHIQTTAAPERALSELKPLNNGVAEFEKALSGTKVINASVSDLQAILRRVFILVGIRANNLPSPEETQILTGFIFKKFAQFTLQEIQIAFEKAVAGELSIDDVSCYENFTPEYFGRIMSAYKKWASQTFNENQMYVIKPQTENLLSLPADWKELVELNYQQFLTGKYNIDLWPWQMYDECVKGEYIDNDAYQDYLIKAYSLTIAKDVTNNAEREWMLEIRKQGIKHTQIIELAKRLCVEILFKTAHRSGYDKLFERG